MITKQSAGGLFVSPGSIKTEIIKEGAAFCMTSNKQFQIVNSNEKGAIPGVRMPSAEIQFMCLAENDPGFNRPNMQKVPDVVIEQRTK